MIGLRSEHQIDARRTAHDLVALGLGDAPGDGNDHVRTRSSASGLHRLEAAELRKHLLRRLLADVTGVEDHHVSPVGTVRRRIAKGCQDVRHAGGVIGIHLAAVGLDEELLRQGRI
jgi:hypothetical protein